jgi:hypothetical protein
VDKNLEVTNFRFVPKMEYNESGKEAPTLACELDVAETDPSIYDWSVAEERGQENTDSPEISDPFQVGPPGTLTLESGLDSAVVATDGVITPRIHATWVEPTDPFVTTGGHIIVQIQPVGGSWATFHIYDGQTTSCYIDGVVCGQQYNVQVCSQRASGALSAWVEAGPETVSVTKSNVTQSVGTGNPTTATYGNGGSIVMYSQTIPVGMVPQGHTLRVSFGAQHTGSGHVSYWITLNGGGSFLNGPDTVVTCTLAITNVDNNNTCSMTGAWIADTQTLPEAAPNYSGIINWTIPQELQITWSAPASEVVQGTFFTVECI